MVKYRFLNVLLLAIVLLLCSSWTDRNIFTVWAKDGDKLIVKGKLRELCELKDLAKNYISNPYRDECLPEMRTKRVAYFGLVEVSKTVVSVQTDRGVTYGFYIAVQNELEKAYNELRTELAQKKFNQSYQSLSPKKKKAIQSIYPIRISEAEPNWIRDKNGELKKNESWYY